MNDLKFDAGINVSRKSLVMFLEVVQRNYLAQQLFDETLSWLDNISSMYIVNMQKKDVQRQQRQMLKIAS